MLPVVLFMNLAVTGVHEMKLGTLNETAVHAVRLQNQQNGSVTLGPVVIAFARRSIVSSDVYVPVTSSARSNWKRAAHRSRLVRFKPSDNARFSRASFIAAVTSATPAEIMNASTAIKMTSCASSFQKNPQSIIRPSRAPALAHARPESSGLLSR